MGDEIAEFLLETAEGRGKIWRSVDCRTIAVGCGELWNVVTRVYLDHRAPKSVTRFRGLPSTRRVVALQEIRPIKSLESILRGIADGALNISGADVRFLGRKRGEDRRDGYSLSYSFSDLTTPAEPSLLYWNAPTLVARGDGIHDAIFSAGLTTNSIDRDLRVAARPFDGLTGLAQRFAGDWRSLGGGRVCTAEVVAPLEARLDEEGCELRDGRLSIRVRVGSRLVLDVVKVSYMALTGDPLPTQGRARQMAARRIGRGPDYYVEFEGVVPNAYYAELFVSLAGHCANRGELYDPTVAGLNPLVRTYQELDPGLSKLRSWLAGNGRDRGNDFESACARLLSLCRIPVNSFVMQSLFDDTVDLLALEPLTRTLLAIECFVAPTQIDRKIGLLASRAGYFATIVQPNRCIPVLATALPRDSIPASVIARAARDGISIICAADLDQILDLAVQDASTSEVLELIASRVPSEPDGAT